VLAIVSIVLWKPFYQPVLTIRASSLSAEPSVGVPVSFTVEKSGILDADSVAFRCYYANVKIAGSGGEVSDAMMAKIPLANVVDSSEPLDFKCPAVYGPPQSGLQAAAADVVVLLSFTPRYGFKEHRVCARFVLGKDAAGQLAWFNRAVGDCEQFTSCIDRHENEHLALRAGFRRDASEDELQSLENVLSSDPACLTLLPPAPH
jgi:hypothetical protein